MSSWKFLHFLGWKMAQKFSVDNFSRENEWKNYLWAIFREKMRNKFLWGRYFEGKQKENLFFWSIFCWKTIEKFCFEPFFERQVKNFFLSKVLQKTKKKTTQKWEQFFEGAPKKNFFKTIFREKTKKKFPWEQFVLAEQLMQHVDQATQIKVMMNVCILSYQRDHFHHQDVILHSSIPIYVRQKLTIRTLCDKLEYRTCFDACRRRVAFHTQTYKSLVNVSN